MDKDYVNIKIDQLIELKDEAIENGYDLNPDLISEINELYHSERQQIENLSPNEKYDLSEVNNRADSLLIETKKVLSKHENKEQVTRLYNNILIPFLGLTLLAGLIYLLNSYSIGEQFSFPSITESTLAAILGIIGSIVYILFNQIGVLNEIENEFKTIDNFSRLSLGAMVGWFFYLIFSDDITSNVILLMLPFLSGFSTKLVVGILNQALQALETTLGIESKTVKVETKES